MTPAPLRNSTLQRRGRGIQSVEVGHRLLAALVATSKPLILRDLAAAANLAPAQAHAYLASFRRIGLVEQNPASGEYCLGHFAMRLGMARLRSHDRLAEASALATRLCVQLGLMVCLVVWGPQAPTVIQVQEGAHPLDLNIREGTLFSVTGTASGRVFGALSEAEAVAARIDAEIDGTVVNQGVGSRLSRRELKREFALIRSRGVSTSLGRPIPGINAASAPIFDSAGDLLAAITLIGDQRALPVTDDASIAILMAEAAKISGTPPPAERLADAPTAMAHAGGSGS